MKMELNKKADSSTDIMWETIILVIIAMLAMLMLYYAVSSQANSTANKEQSITKQLALLIDSAASGSEIELAWNAKQPIFEIRIENNQVCVKLAQDSNGYCYRIFTRYSVTQEKLGGKWIIKII
jgi:hypothetical protein